MFTPFMGCGLLVNPQGTTPFSPKQAATHHEDMFRHIFMNNLIICCRGYKEQSTTKYVCYTLG